jgi:hypothetical protein
MMVAIIGVGVVLVVSIYFIAMLHKKEQQLQQSKQQVAKYKYRAGETQVLLDQLQIVGLPNYLKIPVLDYIIFNYKRALEIDSNEASIKSSLTSTEVHREELNKDPAGGGEKLKLPNKDSELKVIISRIKRFMALYVKLRAESFLAPEAFNERMKFLKKTQLQLEAEGFVKIARKAMIQKQHGTAKQYLEYAKQRLTNCGITDTYVQKQLERIQILLTEISTPKETVAPEKSTKGKDAGGSTDDIFGPKRKW